MPQPATLKFGPYQLDPRTGELRKFGTRIRLQEKPLRLLAALAERQGEMVTREELRQRLWPGDTFIDFETGLNTAVSKVRDALCDRGEKPAYIETIPRRGYRFIAVVEIVSNRAAKATETIVSAPEQVAAQVTRRPVRWMARVMAGCAVAIVLAFSFWWMAPLPDPKITRTYQVTFTSRQDFLVRPATDGARLFYVARAGDHYDLMQVPVGGGDAQKMAAPFANSLIWDVSPDGSRYLMTGFEARGQPSQLWSWPVTGGPPIKLDDMISGSAVWSPDGKSIAYHIGKELWIGKADGSGKKRLATFPLDVDDPAWSPDGTRIRLTLSDAEKDTRSIWEIRADGNGLRNIIDPSWKLTRVSSGSWTPDGRYFLFADHSEKGSRLFALREKGSWWRRSPAGPFLLASDATGSTAPLIGRSGDRVYFYGEAGFRVELQAMQLATNSVSQLLPGMGAIMPGFSRDGHWVAYERISNGSLWRSKLDGSELRELPTPGIQVAFPRWSPDGKFVAFSGHESPEKTNVYVIRQEGGRPEAIAPGEDNLRDPDWSGDGRVLVMAKTDGNGNGQTNAVDRLVTVDWETRKMESVPDSEGMYLPRWSPDNRWIAAVSDEHHGIAVYDTHRKTWKRLAKGRLLGVPAWTADGRSVYFQDLLESGEPLYKIEVASGKLVKVASFEHELERGASRCAFIALTGDGRPVIAIDRSLPDIYGAALVLP